MNLVETWVSRSVFYSCFNQRKCTTTFGQYIVHAEVHGEYFIIFTYNFKLTAPLLGVGIDRKIRTSRKQALKFLSSL